MEIVLGEGLRKRWLASTGLSLQEAEAIKANGEYGRANAS